MKDSVKKLGVDFALSNKGSKATTVRSLRYASGKRRFTRLVKLGLKKAGARVAHAGIIPHVAHGAELYAPARTEVQFVRTMLGSTGSPRPLGVKQAFVESLGQTGGDASLIFIKAALGRWCREAFLHYAKNEARPKDNLSALELFSASEIIRTATLENRSFRTVPWMQ